MALTVGTIIQRARTLNADVQTQGIPDSDLIDMLNQIQADYYNWLLQTAPYVLANSTFTLGYVANQQEYNLPTNSQGAVIVDRIELVEVTDLNTTPLPLDEIPFVERDEAGTPGEPYAYYINAGVIGFVPAPSRTAVNNVRITYVPALVDITYDSGGLYQSVIPSVPGELHGALVYGLSVLMRERDQLPVQTYAVKEEQAKRNFLLNAKRGRGQGVRYMRWIP